MALACSLPWSRENSLPPQQLHTAGFCFPRLTFVFSLSPVLLIALAYLCCSGWTHSEPLSPRQPHAHPLPQTLNMSSGVTLHRGVESEGSGV